MKKYDKKSAIKIIVHAAKEYEEKLNNKHFLIVYQKKSLTKTEDILKLIIKGRCNRN